MILFNQQQLEHLINDALANALFPGIEILYQKDETVYHQAFGSLNGDPDYVLKKHRVFDVASITKPFVTALLLLKLDSLGSLSLHDPVHKYLPNFIEAHKLNVTLMDLATHQAGLRPDIKLYKICETKSEALHEIIHSKLDFIPKTKVQYSCLGYILLGEILERITGKRLPKLFSQYIKNPLKMKKSHLLPNEKQQASLNFVPTGFKPHLNREMLAEVHDGNANFLGGYAGNAGLFATASDLYKIIKNLKSEDERILPNEHKKLLFENLTQSDDNQRSLGFIFQPNEQQLDDIFWSNSVGHTGFTGGSVCISNVENKCLIALSNRSFYAQSDSLDKMKIFRKKLHEIFSNAEILK